MEIIFSDTALKDIAYWKKSGNMTVQTKIQKLLQSIRETPYSGIGKLEGLKYDLAGKWSRRITHEDRLVYEISGNSIKVHSLRGHYL